MAAPRLSTAGMTLQYAVESEAGTRPTTGYTEIPEVNLCPVLIQAQTPLIALRLKKLNI